MTKANAKRKRRNRRKLDVREFTPANTPAAPVTYIAVDEDNRPTAERRARGIWHLPKGAGKSDRPMFDRAEDMIGRLYAEGQITDGQEMAARQWQEIRAAYEAELGTKGYRSCLDIGSGGYDGSDGNPAVMREYRRLLRALGSAAAILRRECSKGPEDKPGQIAFLRVALDKLREVG